MIFRNDEKSSLVLALVKQLGQNFFYVLLKKMRHQKLLKKSLIAKIS